MQIFMYLLLLILLSDFLPVTPDIMYLREIALDPQIRSKSKVNNFYDSLM
jgi:hypothetical protein